MKIDITRRGFLGMFGGAIAALAAPKPLMALAAPEATGFPVSPEIVANALDGLPNYAAVPFDRYYIYVQCHPLSRPIKAGEVVYWTPGSKYSVHSSRSWKGRANQSPAGMSLYAVLPGNYMHIQIAETFRRYYDIREIHPNAEESSRKLLHLMKEHEVVNNPYPSDILYGAKRS